MHLGSENPWHFRGLIRDGEVGFFEIFLTTRSGY
jgi:hypothetical protein